MLVFLVCIGFVNDGEDLVGKDAIFFGVVDFDKDVDDVELLFVCIDLDNDSNKIFNSTKVYY